MTIHTKEEFAVFAKPDAAAILNLTLDWKTAAAHDGNNLCAVEWHALPERLKTSFQTLYPDGRIHQPLFDSFDELITMNRGFLMVQNVAREIVDAHLKANETSSNAAFEEAERKLDRRIAYARQYDTGGVTHDATYLIARMMEDADDGLRNVEKRRVASDIIGAKATKSAPPKAARKFGLLSHK